MPDYYSDKKVLVTGGAGFIGSHLTELLVQRGAKVRVVTSRGLTDDGRRNLQSVLNEIEIESADLRDLEQAKRVTTGQDFVINAAAKVAGMPYNRVHPASMFRDNMLIGLNVIEAARQTGCERYLVVSSACVYRRDCLIPTPETDGFVGQPEETNRGYGWSKRMQEFLGQAYHDEYGMTIGIARPYNCYGPRDEFDPEHSHVIPGIIKRFFDGENPFQIWGNGEQSRSFLYVKDFARGLLEVLEKYPQADALNIGADEETKIKDLVLMIRDIGGFNNVPVEFDETKPIGQPRRHCDVSKAKETIGWQPEYDLRRGLTETIDWYRDTLATGTDS